MECPAKSITSELPEAEWLLIARSGCRSVIDFENLLVFQKIGKTIRASIEACSQDHDLCGAVCQGLLHVIINESSANEHQVGHAGHFAALPAFLIILTNGSRDWVFGD